MWSAAVTTEAPAELPVTLAQAKEFLRLEADDTTFDVELCVALDAAIAEVEAVTSTRLITQKVILQADAFADLEHVPIGPVQALVSVVYLDAEGASQSLADDVAEAAGADLDWAIRPVFGSSWPTAAAQAGAIAVTLRVGYADTGDAVPGDLRAVILRQVRAAFDGRDFDLQAQLVNRRVWL